MIRTPLPAGSNPSRRERLPGPRLLLPLLLLASSLFTVQACNDRDIVSPTALPAVQASVTATSGPAALVISQVYGGGGNSGAPYTHDFVEIFNPTSAAVSLDGLSIQYASATGTGSFGSSSTQLTALTGTVAAGGYFLVQEAGGATGVALPTPDLIDGAPINLAAGAGKVVLVTGTASLGCNGGSTPCSAAQLDRIIDLVGYGSANFFEGSAAAPTLSNTTAALRNDDGCIDTDNNSADFTAGAPAPRNSASPTRDCGTPPDEPGEPATVEVTPAAASVAVGGTQAFTAAAEDEDGQPSPTTFTWSSSDDAIATVNAATGVATGVAAGAAQITATAANGVSGSAELTVTAAPPPSGGSGIAISQVYGGGGNAGTTYTHDFVELFNPGEEPISISGWSVQYTSAAGTSWTNITALSGTIEPGRYYLVQQAQGAGGTTPLPTPDAIGSIAMAATNGKVALVNTTTALSGACPLGGAVVDFVGFGTANCFEGSGATPTLTNTTAALRNEDGCIDTDDNAADFTVGAPTPRNSATPARSCLPPEPVIPTGLVITEFLSDPDGADSEGEWFELFNASDADIDLFGWHLKSNSSTGVEEHTIAASVILPAGGFVVLGNNADEDTNGGVAIAYSYGGDIILNNSNTDWLTIKRPDGTLEDSVSYSSRLESGTIISPQYVPPVATSRVLININQDNTLAGSSNWQNSMVPFGDGRNRGSPGWGAYGVAGPVTSLIIAPASAAVLEGGTTTFSAFPIDALGRVSDGPVTWSSADPTIATVNAATGAATGVSLGVVQIVATAAGGVQGSATLAVVDPNAPATISVSFDPNWVPVGYTKRPFFTVRNFGGAIIPADVTWSVSNPALAEIVFFDGRGYVATLGAGTIQVIATTANGVSGSRTMNILPADAPTSAVYRNHLEFGMPLRDGAPDGILIEKAGFATSYNPALGGPNWVSWNLNATHFGSTPRCNCFSPDLAIPDGVFRVVDADYINSNYDRGHMVQSESRTTTEQENAATFLFTNILPQAPVNNQVSWLAFENHLNNLARQQGREVYVIAGGDYAESPTTINDAGMIPIPDFTWKIAVVMEGGKGLADVTAPSSVEVLAVRMPNLISTAVNTSQWQLFTTTVDAIEEITGYDFLSALPDWIEMIVESGTKPPVAVAGGPYTGVEGTGVAFDGSASFDPDEGDVLSFAWQFGDGTTGSGATPTHSYADNGEYSVRLIVSDQFGAADTTFTTATIANAPPVITSLTVPAAAAMGSPATVSVTYTDAGSADTHTVTFAWGDGSSTTVAGANGAATASHAWADAGFYTVVVTVLDNDGASDERTADTQIAVYDPNGSVAGGGSFDVPAGALASNPAAGGRANLAFSARLTGAAVTGQLELHLNSAGFRFTADAFNVLVVEGSRATASGTGRLRNDSATYSWTLVVEEGQNGQARVRMVIRAAGGAIVFDNIPGAPAGALAPLTGNVSVRN